MPDARAIPPARSRRWLNWLMLAVVVLAVLATQGTLIFNPGYFSHDELQWAAIADQHAGCAFCNGMWADVQAFQYRPLTFSIWIALSRALFVHPYAFHAVMVIGGALNAAMLALLLRRSGAGVLLAAVGAWVFAVGPYAAFTIGWVGTIAELIWVFCALCMGILMQREAPSRLSYSAVFMLTVVALLAKETAVVIPALLLLAWWFSGRRRPWAIATVLAAVPVMIYLAIRLKVILHAPASVGSSYAWSLASIPVRWAEFQLFPGANHLFGSDALLVHGIRGRQLRISALLWLALLWALWRAGPRYLAAFLLASTAALGPVLILGVAATWYGYGLEAVVTGVCVLGWARMSRSARIVLVLVAGMWVSHGFYIMRITHDIGEKQARFSPALAAAIQRAGGQLVTLQLQNQADRWIYLRLTHEIPSYDGVPIGNRVQLVAPGAAADDLILANGMLSPLPVR